MSAVEDLGKSVLDLPTGGFFSRREAGKEQKKARQIEQKRQRLAERRQAIESIRMAQIQRAQVAAAGEVSGVGQASGLLGGLGSIQSQAGANIGFINQQMSLKSQAESRLEKASSLMFRADLMQQIQQTAKQAASGGMG